MMWAVLAYGELRGMPLFISLHIFAMPCSVIQYIGRTGEYDAVLKI